MKEISQTDSKKWFESHWFRYFSLTVFCLILGLVDGIRSYVGSYYNGRFYLDFNIATRWDISGWLIWVALIPLIFWLSNRFPLNHGNWQLALFLYLPLGIVLSLARTFFPVFVDLLFFNGFHSLLHWIPLKFYIFVTDFLIAFIFYSLVLVFGQAMDYYKRYREEELRSSRLELQLSKAQLQALKMQLHPHFLFNALNSISALQMESPEEAQRMTARLGDFLRLTLESVGVQEVSLEQEIEFLKCYLDIEQVRFGNRLLTNINVAPEARSCQVPNLILQPLVENAIRHGIAPQMTVGQIDVTANRENEWLKMEIKDNGRGAGNKSITEMLSSGIGLSNTRARLEQFYGSNFRFELENGDEAGLLIKLCIPTKIAAAEQ